MENKTIQAQISEILGLFMAELALIATKADILKWSAEQQNAELTDAFKSVVAQLEHYMSTKIDEEVGRYYND